MTKAEKQATADRTRWHWPAVTLAWVVLIAFTLLSSALNRDYARMIAGPDSSVWNERLHAGLPVALLLALLLAELTILAGAHGIATVIALMGLGAVAVTVFAWSYAGILYIVTASDPHVHYLLRWFGAAVPDTLMMVATVTLVALRQKAKPVVAKSSVTPWRRAILAAGESVAARAEAAAERQHRAAGPVSALAHPVGQGTSTDPDPATNPAVEGISGGTTGSPTSVNPASSPSVPPGRNRIDAGQVTNPPRNGRALPGISPAGVPAATGSTNRIPAADPAGEAPADPLMAEAEGLRDSLRMRLDTPSVAEILRQLDSGSEPVEVARDLNVDPKTVRKVASGRRDCVLTSVR